MTFQKFFDDVWMAKRHRLLLFEDYDFCAVWDWAMENEEGLWKDIHADCIVAIDTKHTDYKACGFLADSVLERKVTHLIILSGCVCVFLGEVGESE